MNHDCSEQIPQYHIIAIIDTIYKGQYKTLQLMIERNLKMTWLQ